MIAKRVAMKSPKKSSYAGLVAYITATQGKSERVGEVRVTNFENEDVTWAIREAQNVQIRNQRATTDKAYHLLISFAPSESPSPASLRAIEDRICAALGYSDHQRISAVHRDTDCLHIHIAINKVHPTRFTIHQPFNDFWTLGNVCSQLEVEHDLQRVNHTARKSQSENRAADMESHTGVQSLLGWLRSECADGFKGAKSWSDLHAQMSGHGLELRSRGHGLVIHGKEGVLVKASSVARELSKSSLEARLGPFQPNAAQAAGAAPTIRYEGKPLRSKVDTAGLFNIYQSEQSARSTGRTDEVIVMRGLYADRIESAKRAGRLKRATVKLMGGSAANKRLLYALASRSLKSEIQRAREDHQIARGRIASKYQRLAWADWLRARAEEGDAVALTALRSRSVSTGLKGNTVSGAGQGPLIPSTVVAAHDSVTKQGTVIYRAGDAAIRDDGARLQVSRGATGAGLAGALKMAASRYGNRISVDGSAEFKEEAARAAAAARLPITFADAALERRRVALIHFLNTREGQINDRIDRGHLGAGDGVSRPSSSAGKRHRGGSEFRRSAVTSAGGGIRPVSSPDIGKPNIGRIGRKPPPQSKNRLRDMRELGVAGLPGGGEMLLPRDVPSHVDQQAAPTDHGVRRDVAGTGGGVAPSVRAVDDFIAERESKRAKGINISKHVRYTDGFAGAAEYAGTRTSNGETLALVKRGDEVAVLVIDAATARRLKQIKVGDPINVSPEGTIKVKGRSR